MKECMGDLSNSPGAPGRGRPARAQLAGGSGLVERHASGRRGSGAAGASRGHPGGAANTQVSRAEASKHEGLHRPSLPAADGWVLPRSGSPAEGGCVLVAGSTSCWLGCSGGPDPMLWTPELLGDCPRASGPSAGLSAWLVTAQLVVIVPQERTASPWAHNCLSLSFL